MSVAKGKKINDFFIFIPFYTSKIIIQILFISKKEKRRKYAPFKIKITINNYFSDK